MPRSVKPAPANPWAPNRRRTCETCGDPLPREAAGKHGRFCSTACRMRAYRLRTQGRA